MIGKFVFGLLQNQVGIFFTRLIMGVFTTSGLVLFHLYEQNAYFLYFGIALIGLPSLAYNISNVTICNVFHPLVRSAIVAGLSSLVDCSIGVFLIFKVLHETYGYSLKGNYTNQTYYNTCNYYY